MVFVRSVITQLVSEISDANLSIVLVFPLNSSPVSSLVQFQDQPQLGQRCMIGMSNVVIAYLVRK